VSQLHLNLNQLQRPRQKSLTVRFFDDSYRNVFCFVLKDKDITDDELNRINNGRFIPVNDQDNVVACRATSTPTPRENETPQYQSNVQSLGITKQINQVLNDMKSLLTHSREVFVRNEGDFLPERDLQKRTKSQSRRSRKDRATVLGIEQH